MSDYQSDYETWLIEKAEEREREMDEVMYERHLQSKESEITAAARKLRWSRMLHDAPW